MLRGLLIVSCSINLVLIIIASLLYFTRQDVLLLFARTFPSSIMCKRYSSTSPFIPKNPNDELLHNDKIDKHEDLTETTKDAERYGMHGLQKEEPRLTHVIMPYHPSQEARLIENMNSWIEHQPCSMEASISNKSTFKVELMLYPATGRDEEMEKRLVDTFEGLPTRVKACFSKVKVHFASLGSDGDEYLTGSMKMFEQMLSGGMNLSNPSYAMYMEPDARPIQRFWLTHLDSICRFPNESFWIKGSLFRGDLSKMQSPVLYNLYHLNSNALYNLGDPSFPYFYFSLVKPFIANNYHPGAYDTNVFKFLLNLGNYDYVRHVAHKFQITETIQNWWQSEYSIDELNKRDKTGERTVGSNVFIVYGGIRKE